MVPLMLGVLVVIPTPKEELHVVCVHEPRLRVNGQWVDVRVQVGVNRPGKDVTLFLSAYNPCTWEVIPGPRTTVKKVILGGYHKQQVFDAPKGAEIVEAYHEARDKRPNKDYVSAYYNIDADGFRPSAQAIRKFTGMEIVSFQGSYNYDLKKPIFVDKLQNDERLRSDYPRLTPVAELRDFNFVGTRLLLEGRGRTTALFGEFNSNGPEKKSLKALPKDILQVAYDPGAKQFYGITGHDLRRVDLAKGTSTRIEIPEKIKPNWLRCLTYDSKLERVIVSGRNALYEYVTKGDGTWTVLVPNNRGSFAGIAWQASTNTLYAIGHERVGDGYSQAMLYELNVGGAVVARTALAHPMFPGVITTRGFDRAELIDLGGDLAALVYRENWDPDSGKSGKPESFLYLIDPKTGKTKLAWKE